MKKKEQKNANSKGLNATQQKILYIELANPNFSGKEIAAKVGVNEQTVSRHRNTPEYQEAIESNRKSAYEMLKPYISDLIKKAVELARDGNVTVLNKLLDKILPNAQPILEEDSEEENELSFEGWN